MQRSEMSVPKLWFIQCRSIEHIGTEEEDEIMQCSQSSPSLPHSWGFRAASHIPGIVETIVLPAERLFRYAQQITRIDCGTDIILLAPLLPELDKPFEGFKSRTLVTRQPLSKLEGAQESD
jgi:hypothetical protein